MNRVTIEFKKPFKCEEYMGNEYEFNHWPAGLREAGLAVGLRPMRRWLAAPDSVLVAAGPTGHASSRPPSFLIEFHPVTMFTTFLIDFFCLCLLNSLH